MSIANLPPRFESTLKRANDLPWARAIAAGTLVASAWLLVSGRRKAAIATAAAGAAVALLEDPQAVRDFWNRVPDYVQSGQRFFNRLETLVEDLAEKGDHLRRSISGR